MKKTLLVTTILLVTAAGSCPADTIELHNGRIIHGKLAGELPAAGPITISFTGGSSLTIDAARVRRLRRDSLCDFKRPAAKPENKKPDSAEKNTGKKPGAIPPKPEEKKKPAKKEEPGKKVVEPIDAKLEAEILRQVSELSRQRNTNRVRAEAALKRLGPAALPYLEKVARHPFSLARRAVVRIAAASSGNEVAKQLLLAGLDDKDEWVRKLSREALAKRRR